MKLACHLISGDIQSGPAWGWLQRLQDIESGEHDMLAPFVILEDIQTIYFVKEDDAVAFKLAIKLS